MKNFDLNMTISIANYTPYNKFMSIETFVLLSDKEKSAGQFFWALQWNWDFDRGRDSIINKVKSKMDFSNFSEDFF